MPPPPSQHPHPSQLQLQRSRAGSAPQRRAASTWAMASSRGRPWAARRSARGGNGAAGVGGTGGDTAALRAGGWLGPARSHLGRGDGGQRQENQQGGMHGGSVVCGGLWWGQPVEAASWQRGVHASIRSCPRRRACAAVPPGGRRQGSTHIAPPPCAPCTRPEPIHMPGPSPIHDRRGAGVGGCCRVWPSRGAHNPTRQRQPAACTALEWPVNADATARTPRRKREREAGVGMHRDSPSPGWLRGLRDERGCRRAESG